MTEKERAQLIDQLLEGAISEADFVRLEAEFAVDPAAREEYYERLALSVALGIEAEAHASTASSEGRSVMLDQASTAWWRQRTVVAFASGLATAALGVAMFLFVFQNETSGRLAGDPLGEPEEQRARGFGVLTGQVEARWNGGGELADGALLPEGEMALESGVAQLELFSGVMLVMEAPAVFELVSTMEMVMRSGRVRAQVPEPAQGFRVKTVEGELVDLGTEFALDVSPEGAEVHVIDGEVEWHDRQAAEPFGRLLTAGQGVRALSGAPDVESLEASGSDFLGPHELQDRLSSARADRWQTWQQRSGAWRSDPRVVAYYLAGELDRVTGGRLLPNAAPGGVAGAGTVVAAAPAVDRWGRSDGALDFSRTGTRVRVNVPGEYGSLTLMAWVRINSLDRWYNSLFLTDGHEQFEPHWQIMDDGRMFFSVKKRDEWDWKKGERDKHIYFSPSFWEPSLSGQWIHLATTYDIEALKVRHFLNGEVLSEESIPEEYLVSTVRIGQASLANWGAPERDEPHFAVRNLNGSLDEFLLLREALSPEEILVYYHESRS